MNVTICDNGLKIISKKIPHFRMVHLQFRYLIGSRNDYKNRWGIAHYLEHMLFRDNSYFISKMAEYGAVYNAETDIDKTTIYLDVSSENFYKALELILNLICKVDFTNEGTNLERAVILSELDIINDDSYSYGVQQFYYKVLGEYGHPVIGNSNSIKNISSDDLNRFYEKFYTPNNIIVGIAGNIEHKKIVELIDKYYCNKKLVRNNCSKEIQLKSISKHIDYKSDLVQLFWGWNAPAEFSEESYAFKVLTKIFSGDGTDLWTRLFNKCRTELGLSYMIGGIINTFNKNSIYVINSCTDYEQVENLIVTFNRELINLSTNIEDYEIMQSKSMIVSELLSNQDSLQGVVNDIISKNIYNMDHLKIEQEIKFIKKVTKDELLDVLQKYLRVDEMALITIGKK